MRPDMHDVLAKSRRSVRSVRDDKGSRKRSPQFGYDELPASEGMRGGRPATSAVGSGRATTRCTGSSTGRSAGRGIRCSPKICRRRRPHVPRRGAAAGRTPRGRRGRRCLHLRPRRPPTRPRPLRLPSHRPAAPPLRRPARGRVTGAAPNLRGPRTQRGCAQSSLRFGLPDVTRVRAGNRSTPCPQSTPQPPAPMGRSSLRGRPPIYWIGELDRPDWAARAAAMRAIRQFGDAAESAIGPLFDRLENPRFWPDGELTETLIALAGRFPDTTRRAAEALSHRCEECRSRAIDVLAGVGRAAGPYVAELVGASRSRRRHPPVGRGDPAGAGPMRRCRFRCARPRRARRHARSAPRRPTPWATHCAAAAVRANGPPAT